MIKLTLLTTFVLITLCSQVLFSQSEERMIHLSVSAGHIFNKNEFHKYWNPSIGVGGEFSFDHSIGKMGAGLSLMRFDKKIISTKSFYGVDYYFLYRRFVNVIHDLNFVLGFDAGIFEFRFDDDNDIRGTAEQVEREFAIKLVSGFSYELGNTWNAEITTSYNHIYTKKKIDLFYIKFGVAKSFSSPEWLKEFLD